MATDSTIADDILADYINQYRCVPGWRFEAVELNIEIQDIQIELDYSLDGTEQVIELSGSGCSSVHTESSKAPGTSAKQTEHLVCNKLSDTIKISAFININVKVPKSL